MSTSATRATARSRTRLAAREFAGTFKLRRRPLAEELAFVAQVTEVVVERADDVFERLQAAYSRSFRQLEFLQARLHLALAFLHLAGALSQAAVFGFS